MADETMMQKFIAANGEKQTASRRSSTTQKRQGLKPGAPPARKTRMKTETPKQKDRKKLWAFIKLCFIICQRRTLGYTQCMRCGAINPPKLELHHMEHAGKGGAWSPQNAELICAGPDSCHSREHGEPEWSKRRAS